MIAIEDIETHILSNTNPKVLSCLRLSGFHTYVDYMIFTEATVDYIEKYIGIRCGLMNMDERAEYIDEYFINSPEKYMFPIPLRQRLINSVEELHRESEKMMQTVNDEIQAKNTIPDPESPTDLGHLKYNSDSGAKSPNLTSSYISQFIKEEMEDINSDFSQFELKNCLVSCGEQKTQSTIEDEKRFSEEIMQLAAEEFIECHLTPKSDFDLILPDLEKEPDRLVGRYNCLICENAMGKSPTVLFNIQSNGKIQFSKIKKHLSDHFTCNIDVNEIRKQNRILKRKSSVCGKSPASLIEYLRPTEIAVAPTNAAPNRKFLIAQKKKMCSLINEILPKPKPISKPLSHGHIYHQIMVHSNSINQTRLESREEQKT